ncbi:TPA: hypothetical protein SEZ22_000847 [Campylobacter fetus]|uniref:hypothetical protein n=1 Tax=Campylobacter fetus TaxID=196 RepID=UPI00107183D4|nr:hypothetical protein [Campylobacter fetus]HEG5279442.1 hypothetical protein [Campylobacter fetus]
MLNLLKKMAFALAFLVIFVAGVTFDAKFLMQNQFSDKELTFSRNVDESIKVEPSVFISEPRFVSSALLRNKSSLTTLEKDSIKNTFNAIINRAKEDGICTGGSYSIEPSYSYENGKEVIVGQNANAKLSCKITKENLNLYNKFLADVDTILETNEFISSVTPAIRESSDPEVAAKNAEILYDKIIQKALSFEKHYSEITNKLCTTKDINFDIPPTLLRANYKTMSMQGDGIALPITDEQNQKLSANVIYMCK